MTVKEYSDRIVQNIGKVIVGKDDAIRQIVICFLAGVKNAKALLDEIREEIATQA